MSASIKEAMISNIRRASGASLPRTNSNNNVSSLSQYNAPMGNISDDQSNRSINTEEIIKNAATNKSFLLFDEGEEEGTLLPVTPPVMQNQTPTPPVNRYYSLCFFSIFNTKDL